MSVGIMGGLAYGSLETTRTSQHYDRIEGFKEALHASLSDSQGQFIQGCGNTYTEKTISISFHIEWDMIVVTIFISILNRMDLHLVQNRKENCHHDHILFNVKGNGNSFLSERTQTIAGKT